MADSPILKENYKATIAAIRKKKGRKMYADGGEVWDEALAAANAVKQNVPLEQYPAAPATTAAALNVAQGSMEAPEMPWGSPAGQLTPIQRIQKTLGHDITPAGERMAPDKLNQLVQDAHTAHETGNLPASDLQRVIQHSQSPFYKNITGYAEGGMAEAPQEASAPDMVNLVSPEGELGALPSDQAQQALSSGYRQATPEELGQHFKEEEFGSPLEQAKTVGEGAAQGVLGPIAPWLETHMDISTPERMQARQETNPGEFYTGEGAGLIGSSLAGVGEGAAVEAIGKAATAGLPAESAIAKIGSAAARGATENMLVQSSDEVSKMLVSDDPKAATDAAQTALVDIGLAGLIGGGFGGVLGTARPIFDTVSDSKLGKFLSTFADKAGGVEGQDTSNWLDKAINTSGIDVPPAVKSALSDNETLRHAFATLVEGGSTRSAEEARGALDTFKQAASGEIAKAMGTSVDKIPLRTEISNFEAGKDLGHTLADEYSAKVDPLAKQYESYSQKYKSAPLEPSIAEKSEEFTKANNGLAKEIEKTTREALKAQESGSVEKSVELAAKLNDLRGKAGALKQAANAPGTMDKAIAQIMDRAHAENWTLSPSSDIMREVNRVVKELPNVKTLEGLTGYIKQVGANTASTMPFGMQTPVSRAGGIIKGILRKAEGEALGKFVGSDEGVEALNAYRGTQQAYAKVAALKDSLDERLKVHGSVSGFGKALKNMSQTDGEQILRRLSGRGDAALFPFLTQEFPKTAELLRQTHLEHLLAGAKTAEGLNAKTFFKNLNNPKQISPELRDFLTPAGGKAKLEAIQSLLEAIPERIGPSGTPKTLDSMWQHIPASVGAMAAALGGHSPVAGALIGQIGKILGRDVPDAARLALLKFMGSNAPINSAGFRSMVEFAEQVARGESRLTKGVENVFKAGTEVLPESQMPNEKSRAKLDKTLQSYQTDPGKLLDLHEKTGHYLPDHATAMSGTATQIVGMMNNMRPSTQVKAPLDSPRGPSPMKQAEYQRTLDIAQQPLVILSRMKQGTMTAKDVANLKAMYPALYGRMAEKLSGQMMDQVAKGKTIPYALRLQLSSFLGQPLDSTMTPQAILGAQMANSPSAGPQQPAMGKPKGSPAKLGGMAKSAQTKSQFRESARSGAVKD